MKDEYFDELEQWKHCVGTAILSFGEIELITLRCLEHFPKDNIYKSTSSLALGRRIDLLIEILEERRGKTEIENIISMLKRVKDLTKFRNLLAHNPLMANVFEHVHTDNIEVKMVISSIRSGNNAIDLEEIKELSDEVENLASDLWISFSKATGDDRINT